jgi:hypothetical protein
VERVMTVTPLLANQGFDQRQIEDMSTALIAVCSRLGLADHSDIVTDKVAKTIIELAQRGVHDPCTLRKITLMEFNIFEE